MTTAAAASVDERTARFSALGDPIRWEIVRSLASGQRCVCDLEDDFELSQSRLSYHLGILRRAGLIQGRREGRWTYYSLMPEAFEECSAGLQGVAKQWLEVGSRQPKARC